MTTVEQEHGVASRSKVVVGILGDERLRFYNELEFRTEYAWLCKRLTSSRLYICLDSKIQRGVY